MAIPSADLESAFPDVHPGEWPVGPRILVQFATIREKTQGGIVLVEETQDTEKWNIQTAKIVAVGPLAFRNRDTGDFWTEGQWVEVGDFVRVPRWGGDRFKVQDPNDPDSQALFVVFNDHEVIAKISGDPLAQKAFLL